MNSYLIKWIAIITMIIDHLGLFLFPQFFLLRIIGRLSFPLFAWLIASGARHTHNIYQYLLRLYLFSLLSQVPYLMANKLIDPQFGGLNVLCTLFLGLAAIAVIQRIRDRKIWVVVSLLSIALATFLQTDYGGFGVAVIICFYLFFDNFPKLLIGQFLLFSTSFLWLPANLLGLLEPVGIFSLVFIKFYNNKQGPSVKYLFYFIYPLQFVVFYFLLTRLLAIV